MQYLDTGFITSLKLFYLCFLPLQTLTNAAKVHRDALKPVPTSRARSGAAVTPDSDLIATAEPARVSYVPSWIMGSLVPRIPPPCAKNIVK